MIAIELTLNLQEVSYQHHAACTMPWKEILKALVTPLQNSSNPVGDTSIVQIINRTVSLGCQEPADIDSLHDKIVFC
jgi:hypothetical protein